MHLRTSHWKTPRWSSYTRSAERMAPEVDFVPRIPLACVTTGMAEQEAVLSVLRSGHLASGAKVQEFERAFAAAQGCQHAVAVSNGTVALIASLRAHGI